MSVTKALAFPTVHLQMSVVADDTWQTHQLLDARAASRLDADHHAHDVLELLVWCYIAHQMV
jgi:hypothetical protein